MAWLRSFLLLLIFSNPTCGHAQGVALCPSVLLINKPHHRSGVEQLRKVARLGFSEANLVVSLRCEIDQGGRVLSYGFVSRGEYQPLDRGSLASFRAELLSVLREAKRHGLKLSILPHLDSAGENHDWRNHYDFDPLKFYQGYSYDQAMIESITAALSAAGYGEDEIHFALCGEMGRSLFLYPESYLAIIKQIRADPRHKNTRIGVSLNFSEVDGKAGDAQASEVEEVFQQCEFLGFSDYRPFTPPPSPEHFANSKASFLEELKRKGIHVSADIPLHLSEAALGGGSVDSPVAMTPFQAAASPWEGSADPQRNPWEDAELRGLRKEYHEALLSYLADPTARGLANKNPMTAAYLWCEGSWDPLDISQDGFADPAITQLIQRHNDKAFNAIEGNRSSYKDSSAAGR